ncbi:MAG: ATP-dependent RecD-like DNA helicase, partial [Verrucomicrobiales bacterium]
MTACSRGSKSKIKSKSKARSDLGSATSYLNTYSLNTYSLVRSARPLTMSESITGTIERVTFHADDTGYSILRVKLDGRSESATVLCNAPSVHPGEQIHAEGQWIDNRDFGRQFKAAETRILPPISRFGLERFLGSGLIHGIGPTYAKKLVDRFGDKIFEVIDNSSKRLEEVEGIGKKRRLEIKASWDNQNTLREIMVFLYQHGLGTTRALRIHKEYGADAIALLRENPYRLCRDIHGIGFKISDGIARSLGLSETSPERAAAGIRHVLATASDRGHCALPDTNLLEQAAELLNTAEETILPALESLVEAGELARETPPLEGVQSTPEPGISLIYLPPLLHAEKGVALHILALTARPPEHPEIDIPRALAWCEQKSAIALGESQQAAVAEALKRRILIITGGPGVGKTTILNTILLILSLKKVQPVLCAPTGRAAKRLCASTGREASTIHRLLEFQGGGGFARNEQNPLKGDLFVMDESSMVDISLMHAFLRALPENAHLLLVGDVDQLPSVGPGNVLRDLIESGVVPTVRLTEIFRQADDSRIVRVAREINEGRLPELSRTPGDENDFFFIERNSPEAVRDTIVELVRRRLPDRFGLDPVHDIQLLTPMNRNALGTVALNDLLQAALNPENEIKMEVERFGTCFRAGDRVIQVRNDYEKDVFNGDIGVIARIDIDPVLVHVRFEDGRSAEYEPGELDELALAYAITIHKSQGSEFPVVIIPVSTQHYVMLQRNLLYTGITRGRRMVILVGDPKALAMAVANAQTSERCSAL